MLWGEATHINFIVFGLTRLGLEPTIYCIRGQQATHYTTDAVDKSYEQSILLENTFTYICIQNLIDI